MKHTLSIDKNNDGLDLEIRVLYRLINSGYTINEATYNVSNEYELTHIDTSKTIYIEFWGSEIKMRCDFNNINRVSELYQLIDDVVKSETVATERL